MIIFSRGFIGCVFLSLVTLLPGGESPKEPAKVIAREVHYSGQVQGVGFRDTAVQIARKHPVTGWVKNLEDGRVQLVAEGQEAGVLEFLDALRKHWKKNIEKERIEELKPSAKYKSFSVVR